MAFTKLFIKPSLMCKGGSRSLSGSTRAGGWIFFCPIGTFSATPFLPQVVQFNCSAVPLTYMYICKKHMYFVYPCYIPIKRTTTFKSPQRCQLYFFLYPMVFSSCFKLSHVSFMRAACTTGIDGRRIPLCKRLSFQESTNSILVGMSDFKAFMRLSKSE